MISFTSITTFMINGAKGIWLNEKYINKDHMSYVNQIKDKWNGEYEVLSEFKNMNSRVMIKHAICGMSYRVRAWNALHGSGCKYCILGRRTTHTFKEEVKKLTSAEYEVLGEFKSTMAKILMKHIHCGYEYMVTPGKFISSGRRCPRCRHDGSILADDVERFLLSYGLEYKREYRIENCRHILPLPFDFAIFKDGDVVLIEVDGLQHFRQKHGRLGKLDEIMRNDAIKTKYANDNGITLIRIPYFKAAEMESILMEHLSEMIEGRQKNTQITMLTNSTLSVDDVKEIRVKYANTDITSMDLSVLYGVSKTTIKMILNYTSYHNIVTELKDKINQKKGKSYKAGTNILSQYKDEIIAMVRDGYSHRNIAKKYKANHSTVSRLIGNNSD